MPSIYTQIEIRAPRLLVWDALIRKQDWYSWNTFLFDQDPSRALTLGQPVALSLRRVASEAETEFEATVTLMQRGTCLKWIATAPGFQSEHIFELQDSGWQRTQYVHRENFSGPLTRLFLPFIRQDEQQGIKRMANDLRTYVERSSVAS